VHFVRWVDEDIHVTEGWGTSATTPSGNSNRLTRAASR
jgi:hypothetical protein